MDSDIVTLHNISSATQGSISWHNIVSVNFSEMQQIVIFWLLTFKSVNLLK